MAESYRRTPYQSAVPPEAIVRNSLYGFRNSVLIFLAVRLGLAMHLREGPQTSIAIAEKMHWDYPSVQRIMIGLTAIGVLAESWEGHFSLTPAGRLLDPDHPDSMYPEITLADYVLSHAWAGLQHTVMTGEPAFQAAFQMSFYEFLQKNRDFKMLFSKYMNAETQIIAQIIVAACSETFARIARFVDVGGGVGTVAAAVLLANPHLQGLVFEKPEMQMPAQGYLRTAGVESRCHVMPGDFFQGLPTGGDVYILSQILHDWKDEECIAILRNCYNVVPPSGILLIVEALLPQFVVGPAFAIDQDINMLALTHGHERTQEEYRHLLEQAGFTLRRTLPTEPYSVLEAMRL